jgi:RNA ligase
MTNMLDIFGAGWPGFMGNRVADGLITVRAHPGFPELAIANYTPKAAYDRAWDAYTLTCRGLIYNRDTGDVLARPFQKFFNYGQPEAPAVPMQTDLYHVSNKWDGSLGIGYIRPDGKFSIATRGSFDSEQARHANELLETQPMYQLYKGDIHGLGATPLFEIIYPENRIVLNYGDKDGLQFLGWVKLDTGEYMPSGTDNLFGDRITLYDLLQLPPRPNAEGWVVWTDPYTALKIKQDDYVALHKIVTNLSERTVWEAIKREDNDEWRAFVEKLPDELQPWAEQIAGEIEHAVRDMEKFLYAEYDRVNELAWKEAPYELTYLPRKEFALAVQKHVQPEYRSFMFSIADSKSIIPKLYDMFKPEGNTRPRNLPEEEA